MVDLTVEESRYARQELITWWEQDRLARGRVLVVGAGALGNELVKDLALLGVGHIDVVDMDVVETSNLARCSLLRPSDIGRPKVEALVAAASDLNPDCEIGGSMIDVRRLPLGRLARYDVVVGGLDNREARLFVNQACRKLGIPWVDGAIEGLRGVAKVFLPDGPCYECTLGEVDRQILSKRKSCGLLSEEELLDGKVPTTITTAALIAAVQAQETVKLLHGDHDRLALSNQGWNYVGETGDAYVVDYGEDEWCQAHDRYESLRPWPDLDAPLADVVAAGQHEAGGVVEALDLEGELVVAAHCAACGPSERLARLVDLARNDARCGACGGIFAFDTRMSLAPDDPLLQCTPAHLGLPRGDVVTVRSTTGRVHYELGARP